MTQEKRNKEVEVGTEPQIRTQHPTPARSSMLGFALLGVIIVAVIGLAIGYFVNPFIGLGVGVVLFVAFLALSLKTIDQKTRGLIERFGQYNRSAQPGLIFLIPFVEKLIAINVTEIIHPIKNVEVLTSDSLFTLVDLQVYFRIKDDEQSVKNSQYNVNDVELQIEQLARSRLQGVVGRYTLKDANAKRQELNDELAVELKSQIVHPVVDGKQTGDWGVLLVRVEITDIKPTADVAESLENVIKMENAEIAAKHDAERKINEARGDKESKILISEATKQTEILVAQGKREALILDAQGKAEAIRLVNDMAEATFTPKAQLLKTLEVAQKSLENNTKVVIAKDTGDLLNIVGDTSKMLPIPKKEKDNE